MPDVRWLEPQHRGPGCSRRVFKCPPAGISSGARSPFFSDRRFGRPAASSFDSLHPAHESAPGAGRPFGLRDAQSRRLGSRFRSVATSPDTFSSSRRRASFGPYPGPSAMPRFQPFRLSRTSARLLSPSIRPMGRRLGPSSFGAPSPPPFAPSPPNPGMQRTRYARR